ncbi:hypothetical protein B0H13DRAFT_1928523 [Mycena leptocephala]|nr:hypothetical protein B0H13DRAFT_1928523 [Mycena leptocephala]
MAYISALTFMFGQYIGRCVTCTSTRAREDVGDESMTRAAKGKWGYQGDSGYQGDFWICTNVRGVSRFRVSEFNSELTSPRGPLGHLAEIESREQRRSRLRPKRAMNYQWLLGVTNTDHHEAGLTHAADWSFDMWVTVSRQSEGKHGGITVRIRVKMSSIKVGVRTMAQSKKGIAKIGSPVQSQDDIGKSGRRKFGARMGVHAER